MIVFAAPAVAADMPARTYTKAPVYTAPQVDLQLDRLLHRRPSRRRVRGRQQPRRQRRPVHGRRAGRLRLPVRHQLGDRRRGPVQLAFQQQQQRRAVSGRHAGDREQQPARLGHRPARLHLGSGAALRQGRLTPGATIPISASPSPARRWRSPPRVPRRMATPSAPASNTCSRRTGRPRPNTSITISATPPSPAVRRPIIGSRFRDDEHTVKVGVNYRFGWGGPVATRY